MNIEPGAFHAAINVRYNKEPSFKDEKTELAPSAVNIKIIKAALESVAKSTSNATMKEGWGETHKTRQLREPYYTAIANTTNLSVDEVKNKIRTYVETHPDEVLNIARDIAKITGANLDNTTREEFLKIVAEPSRSILSFMQNQQPSLLNRHLANFVLAKIASDLFHVNIVLRDVVISYESTFGGHVTENWRLESLTSKDAPAIHLIQGLAIMNQGFFDNQKTKFYHIEPQEITPNPTPENPQK